MQELYQKNAFSDKTKRGKEAKLLLHFFTPSGYSGRSGRIRRISGFSRRSGLVTGAVFGTVGVVTGAVVFLSITASLRGDIFLLPPLPFRDPFLEIASGDLPALHGVEVVAHLASKSVLQEQVIELHLDRHAQVVPLADGREDADPLAQDPALRLREREVHRAAGLARLDERGSDLQTQILGRHARGKQGLPITTRHLRG